MNHLLITLFSFSLIISVIRDFNPSAALSIPRQKNKLAEVWISEKDGTKRLERGSAISFVKQDEPEGVKMTIEVDPAKAFQLIDGMGSSLEPATCFNLMQLPDSEMRMVLKKLLSADEGIGMNQMRICIGTPDFTGDPWYTYCDLEEGMSDTALLSFSIEKDRRYIIPVLKEAMAINPRLRLFASPWSPPGWMKTSGSIIGGSLKPEYYSSYARYFVKFIKAYQEEGIPVYAVTIQNEPGVDRAQGSAKWHYPSCHWTAEQERDFIRDHLGPAFKSNGLDVEIWCYDHNFNIKAVTDGSPVFIPEKPGDAGIGYPRTILNDPDARRYVRGIAFHGYVGTPSGMSEILKEFPYIPVRFTEGSVFGLNGGIELIRILRNSASSYNAWVTMLDERRKPNNGPFEAARTIIERNSVTNEVLFNFDYFMYGHFMKFIKTGSVRISSYSEGDLNHIAFLDPDDNIVLIMINNRSQDISTSVRYDGRSATVRMSKNSICTMKWER